MPLTFSRRFNLVRVVMDPVCISGTLGVRWIYMNSSPSQSTKHTFIPRGNLSYPVHLPVCLWDIGGNKRTWRKLWKHGDSMQRNVHEYPELRLEPETLKLCGSSTEHVYNKGASSLLPECGLFIFIILFFWKQHHCNFCRLTGSDSISNLLVIYMSYMEALSKICLNFSCFAAEASSGPFHAK